MLKLLELKLNGISPLLLHNGQTADPLNRFSKQMKAVTGKKKKTDEDYAEISRIEWFAALYVDKNEKLIIPAEMLEANIVEGAKKSRLGKAFKSSVFVEDDSVLEIGVKYNKAGDLWEKKEFVDVRGVRVKGSRVMRTRPIFHNWSVIAKITYDDEQVDLSDVRRAITDAGFNCGLGDFRPRFGRFEVVE